MKKIISSYIFRKVLPASLILFSILSGIIKVDIINTKALSPLGNTNENYKLVSDEFGEDFSKFIKDNSYLKIYKEKQDNILIRLGENDFKISNQSIFTKKIQGVFESIINGIKGAKDTIEKLL